MSMATMKVLEVDELKVLADGGYSNAQAVAQCERDNVEVAAPIKRMSGGGRFLTRGPKAVKAEAALSILAFNMLHAVNAFGD